MNLCPEQADSEWDPFNQRQLGHGRRRVGGGGLYLCYLTIEGAGAIQARGGSADVSYGGGGGGGRISIRCLYNHFYGSVSVTNATTTVTYSDVQGGALPGAGNLSQDPLFVDMVNSNYHVKSLVGAWSNSQWVAFDRMSPCIDAGEPGSPYALEPKPNGKRVNLGRYGNTAEASLSSRGTVIRIW